MNNLRDILYGVRITDVVGSTDLEISGLTLDSRKTVAGSLFAAIRGTQVDGHHYIDQAVKGGAVAVVAEELPNTTNDKVTYIIVQDSSAALAVIAENFFDNPSKSLSLVGITGTNGKTTIATLCYHLFTTLGFKTGLLSTIENRIGDQIIESTHTTADAITISGLLRKMLDSGCTHCFMEVSSHALHQNRTTGLDFNGAVFTNITHDHLDYHKTFKDYLNTKKKLFDDLSSDAFAISNYDDKNGKIILQNSNAKKVSYAIKSIADYKGKILENSFDGLVIQVENYELHSKLVGDFNAYNLIAIYAVARELEVEALDALTAISDLDPAEGRFEYFTSINKVIGIVDYAHTPDALVKVLKTIQSIRTGNEKLITVVGCGGNRDKTKRPLMAKVACENSDKVVFTSDNPRNESPQAILHEMEEAVRMSYPQKYLVNENREHAIQTAITMAEAGDIVLVAGKGHEKYQEIMGEKHPFDDMMVLKQALKTQGK